MANLRRLGAALLDERRYQLKEQRDRRKNPDGFWPWLSLAEGRRLSKREANKFLLYCILDYRINAITAIENARRLAEDVFGDPDSVWQSIASVSTRDWEKRYAVYKLHWLRQAHGRVRRIAEVLVRDFQGDARLIWKGRTSDQVAEVLGFQVKLGPELTHMAVLALLETGVVRGGGNLKADVHVRRVLGRATRGKPFGTQDVRKTHELVSEMMPKGQWKLDLPLYQIGRVHCKPRNPNCVGDGDDRGCPLARNCIYARMV